LDKILLASTDFKENNGIHEIISTYARVHMLLFGNKRKMNSLFIIIGADICPTEADKELILMGIKQKLLLKNALAIRKAK